MKNKLFIFESTEWTRVRSQALETHEIFDPAFICMLPANAQAYFAKYGKGALAPSGTVVTAGQLGNAGLTLARSTAPRRFPRDCRCSMLLTSRCRSMPAAISPEHLQPCRPH